jgi:hypothetical protein
MTRTSLFLVALLPLASCTRTARPVDPCSPDGKALCSEQDRNLCVMEGDRPRCLCNAGYVQRPSGVCELIGEANCPQHTGDSAEPDDCLAKARLIATGEAPRSASIDPLGDYDYVRIDATAKHVYTFESTGSGSLLPRLDAFDQGGSWLTGAEQGWPTRLQVKAAFTAPLYVRVSHSPVDPSVATGDYSLSYSSAGQEDHGDLREEATEITPSGPGAPLASFSGRFEYPADADWFKLSAALNVRYKIAFESTTPPYVELYLGTAAQPYWSARQQVIDFDFLQAGPAYLVIYAPPEQGTYSFTFTRAP